MDLSVIVIIYYDAGVPARPGKSFATSAFKIAYDKNEVVLKSRDQVMDRVRAFLTAYAALVGAEPAHACAGAL